MSNITNLSAAEQGQFQKFLEETSSKDSLLMYNHLVSQCFDTCVSSFKSKSLDSSEVKCVESCAGKFIKSTQRVGVRFQEQQAMMQALNQNGTGGT